MIGRSRTRATERAASTGSAADGWKIAVEGAAVWYSYRGDIPFFSGGMSTSSASVSHSKWPRFGPVPLGRCPGCGRTASLKRRVTTSDKNGNRGREYVTCESKEQPGEVRYVFPPLSISFYVSSNLGFQPIWVFIRFGYASDLGFHICRICFHVTISSGLMCTSRGFKRRANPWCPICHRRWSNWDLLLGLLLRCRMGCRRTS